MIKRKKFLATLLALLSTVTLAALASCGKEEPSSSSSSSSTLSSSSQESSSSIVDSSTESSSSSTTTTTTTPSESFSGDTTDRAEPTEWSEWICDPATYAVCKEPTCTEDGVKLRYKLADETITETATIPARGHDYAINASDFALSGGYGCCIRCQEDGALRIPTLTNPTFVTTAQDCDHSQTEINTGECSHEYKGTGTREPLYNALELTEGCYELTIKEEHASDGLWISFSASQDGQYVLYSVGENEGVGFTVTRYNVSLGGGYVNENGGVVASVKEDNFYSFVNPGSTYSSYWRATYRIQGAVGETVRVCFTRYAEKTWERGNVTSYAYATEINETYAPEGAAGTQLTDVPFDTTYYFDQTTGYYTMENGSIIYVAIDKTSRQFVDGGALGGLTGQSLVLQDGYTADGDYRTRNYVPMIMNWKYNNASVGDTPSTKPEVNPNKNCYQNYCNSDGLYPVTKELYKFLNLYVRANQPMDEYITEDDYAAELQKSLDDPTNWLWLANCYYYADPQTGTTSNPQLLTLGANDVTLPILDEYYVKIADNGVYTVSWTESDLSVKINGQAITGVTQITVQAPLQIRLYNNQTEARTVTLTLAYATQVVDESTTTLSPVAAYQSDASAANAYVRYEYAPTADGTLTFTRTGSESATVTINGEEVTTSKDIQVTANTPVVILVSADTPVDVAVTLAFTPAA